ncbi:sulfite exporter TauE/SafE family protein [Pseudodonghicola flavimaris]|uniref:Probable membrane transporter protein n=1 Tax=Pseudodonghicola flavimaris TaxID=3050036 RepID=A0ABT7F7C0_9RHOB|nr:sulfite exporter TauE/SafE family protein [Pseudodonghicola flavimaris]MDK3020502.1 sulfite exporter TauE/SafE family protein [Pseudodonghicola flavimaris]
MPEALSQALATPGLVWLALAAFVAGTVRGFAGFGTALVFMPVAALVLPPVWAIITVALMDAFGPMPNLPGALRQADRRDLLRMSLAALLGLPLGLWVLGVVAPEVFRFGVSFLALGMLLCLIAGVRYHGRFGPGLIFGTGGLSGFLGGAAGLPGPPVILLYMASPHPAPVVRASTLTYLFLYNILLLALLGWQGMLNGVPIWLGLMLALPNVAGNVLGGVIFRPGLEKAYRAAAYTVIAGAAVTGLPVWG